MFVRLSRELEKAGIGSVRFDFSGHGESDGLFENMTASNEIQEAKAIFNYMRELDCSDKDNLFMLGMSMGGMVASVAAPEVDRLKGLVLWAPAANMYGYAEKIIEKNIEYTDEFGRVDIGGLLLNPNFQKDLKTIDVYSRAANFPGDVLIIHGTEDEIPIEVSYQYKRIYKENAKLIEVQGSDHAFSRAKWKDILIGSTIDFLKEKSGIS